MDLIKITLVATSILLPIGLTFAQQTPPATPQQVIDQVRAAQTANIPVGFAQVPAPPMPPPRWDDGVPAESSEPIPTRRDKRRLESELRHVNSLLKIRENNERSTERAAQALTAQGKMLYTYTPGGLYEVQTATFHETALQLQPGETLTGGDLPTAGDTARWAIAATRSGTPPNETTVLIVKPLESDLDTNMTITTNRRLYTVLLKSDSHTYMPLVGWLYAQDEAQNKAAKETLLKKAEAESEPISIAPEALNFDCKVTGADVPWKPLRVFDDGWKTYLQMSREIQSGETPAIFVIQDKAPILVNFRIKHAVYIVDRLFDQAELRIGPKTAVDVRCSHHLAKR